LVDLKVTIQFILIVVALLVCFVPFQVFDINFVFENFCKSKFISHNVIMLKSNFVSSSKNIIKHSQ